MKEKNKKNYKNRLWFGSKISQYKMEKVLRCFANGDTTLGAHLKTRISRATIRKIYAKFREKLYYGAILHRDLFNGAGILLLFGPPPNYDDFVRVKNERSLGQSSPSPYMTYELIIRSYMRYQFTPVEKLVFMNLAIMIMADYHKIMISEISGSPLGKYIFSGEHKAQVSLYELNETIMQKTIMHNYINALWADVLAGKYRIPGFIWTMLFYKRKTADNSDRIYNDLRWFLLKYPINVKNEKISEYWGEASLPPMSEVQKTMENLLKIVDDKNNNR